MSRILGLRRLSSSLWELYNHRSHCHQNSAVSTLAGILPEAFTKPGYAMEDFLDHIYHTVSPPVQIPNLILTRSTIWGLSDDELVYLGVDVVSELWTFQQCLLVGILGRNV